MSLPADDIRRAKHGDREALDRLLSRLHARLEQIARQRLGRDLRTLLETSDLLQSAYMDVVRGVRSFQGEDDETFVGWVVRIIERNAQDRTRWANADRRREPLAAGNNPPGANNEPRSVAGSPSHRAAVADELFIVSRALDTLPPDQRQVLELKLIEDRPHEEIARILDRSEQATRSLLLRARAALLLAIDRQRSGIGKSP